MDMVGNVVDFIQHLNIATNPWPAAVAAIGFLVMGGRFASGQARKNNDLHSQLKMAIQDAEGLDARLHLRTQEYKQCDRERSELRDKNEQFKGELKKATDDACERGERLLKYEHETEYLKGKVDNFGKLGVRHREEAERLEKRAPRSSTPWRAIRSSR